MIFVKNLGLFRTREWLAKQAPFRIIYESLILCYRPITFAGELFFSHEARREFRNKIAGNKIAIVGPAPMSFSYEENIDSSDFVIRVGKEHWPWEGTGSKVDAWVCDGTLTQELLRGEGEIPDAAWIILKNGPFHLRRSMFGFLKALRLKWRASQSNTRVLFAYVPSNWKFRKQFGATALGVRLDEVNLNQVPMALFEACRHNPQSIEVYGSDYYQGEVFYAQGSPEKQASEADKESFLANMLRSHDQIVQRQICRALLLSGDWIVGGSDEFLRLTRMSEIEFKLKVQNTSPN